jgi:hypothetical protein
MTHADAMTIMLEKNAMFQFVMARKHQIQPFAAIQMEPAPRQIIVNVTVDIQVKNVKFQSVMD